MAEPRALYGMCLKADTYAAREACMVLSITMYLAGSSRFPTDGERLLVSSASETAIEPGNVVQCGPCWRARSGRVDRRWSDARAGMRVPRPVARAWPGGFCGTIHKPLSVWAIRVMSWGRSGILPLSEMTLPETKWCGFRPKLADCVRGRGQSECLIQVMTLRFGVALRPALQFL